ncbi:type II secretion system GspH family protein [Patescibacteria group bacterium]|nr:type II secretion system GspH family protein [Patescibacteria group bacterium]
MKKQQGFTLIEMLIVVILLAITVGVTSDILISLVRSNTKTQVLNEIEQQANFVLLKLEKELRDAKTVTRPTPEEGGRDRLIFTRKGDDAVIDYRLEGGKLVRAVTILGNTPTHDLTSTGVGGVSVSCPSNQCFTVSGPNPQVVKIDMTFRSGGGMNTYLGDTRIQSTIVIRSTY